MKIAFAASHISDETRLKMINAAHNREPFSLDTRRKMSESHKGNTNRLGKNFTPEQIKKISRNRKGITGIEYHLRCKNCNSEFISTGPGGKYCKNCKEKLNG